MVSGGEVVSPKETTGNVADETPEIGVEQGSLYLSHPS